MCAIFIMSTPLAKSREQFFQLAKSSGYDLYNQSESSVNFVVIILFNNRQHLTALYEFDKLLYLSVGIFRFM